MFGNTNLSNNFLQDLQGKTDSRLMGWLSDMHNSLNKDRISIKELDSLVKALEHMNSDAREDYINTLLYPETIFGKKIPTLFPIPSSTFQMHLVSANLTPNANGNIAFTWNPCFLQDSSLSEYTTFYVNNDSTLNGSTSSAFFKSSPININQIPSNLYGNWRLVSASVVVSYIGRMDIVSGVLGVGIGLNNSGVAQPVLHNSASPSTDANSTLFSNFIQIDNLLFSDRTQAANGLRAIYFPIDDRYTNFLAVANNTSGTPGFTLSNCFNTGFYIAGYGQNLPTSAASLRFDFYLNIEAIVTPQFNNFIPQSTVSSSGIDAIQAASMLTKGNTDKIIVPSSDIPGAKGNNDISAGNLISKLAGSSDYLPSIDVIKRIQKY